MMPFFQDWKKIKTKYAFSFFKYFLKKFVTLQVRFPQINNNHRGKRVSLTASSRVPASLTVEAALCLSLFLFFSVSLVVPLKMMDTQRQMQAVLETVGEDLSQYGYIKYQMDKGGEAVLGSSSWNREFLDYLTSAAFAVYLETQIRRSVNSDRFQSLSLSKSQIMRDGETLRLVAEYDLKLPFPVFRISEIPASSVCCRRAWIGREGGRGESGGKEDSDETVYIGKKPTRYHRSRECHYLDNDVYTVLFDEVQSEKNSQGRHYHPCAVCGGRAGKGDTVYIMPSGDHFHSDRYCSSIVAYVEAVPLSQVEGLGECSYCGIKEESK